MILPSFNKARAAYWRLQLLIKPARRRAAWDRDNCSTARVDLSPGLPIEGCGETGEVGVAVASPVQSFIHKSVSLDRAGFPTALRLSRERVGGGFSHNFLSSAKNTNDNFAALRKV